MFVESQTERILHISGHRHLFSQPQTQPFLGTPFKNYFRNDMHSISNAITAQAFQFLVLMYIFHAKGNTGRYLPSVGLRKNFPPCFCHLPPATPAITSVRTQKLLKGRGGCSGLRSAPPAHRRLHLVTRTRKILGKNKKRKPVDNNCYRFSSCPSKTTGLSCPCFLLLALLSPE